MFSLPSRALLRRFAPWLILLLFLAQGARVCLPTVDGVGQAAGAHLESVLTTFSDHHETEAHGEVDVPLSALLQIAMAVLAFALVAVALLPLMPPAGAAALPRPDDRCFRPPRGSGLTPPLRAPPR